MLYQNLLPTLEQGGAGKEVGHRCPLGDNHRLARDTILCGNGLHQWRETVEVIAVEFNILRMDAEICGTAGKHSADRQIVTSIGGILRPPGVLTLFQISLEECPI